MLSYGMAYSVAASAAAPCRGDFRRALVSPKYRLRSRWPPATRRCRGVVTELRDALAVPLGGDQVVGNVLSVNHGEASVSFGCADRSAFAGRFVERGWSGPPRALSPPGLEVPVRAPKQSR